MNGEIPWTENTKQDVALTSEYAFASDDAGPNQPDLEIPPPFVASSY